MAEYKALTSFSGQVAMAAGEVREIADSATVADLMQAGYIEELKAAKPRTPRKRKAESDEN